MKRVCVVITARPSYSRIKTALLAMQQEGLELQIIAAASALTWRHGRIVDVLWTDGFPVEAEAPAVVDGGSRREAVVETGLLTVQLGPLFDRLKPDCVVTIADRHETLATAIAASYQHIPLCHIQGGEVSGSIDDKVRNAITQLADLHLVATQQALGRVMAQLKPAPGRLIEVTGCPSIDLAAEAVAAGPTPMAEVVVLQHPVTGEVEQAAEQMRATIQAVPDDALFFWPGEEPGADAMSKELRMAGLKPVRNLEPVKFLRTLLGAKVLVGNSSVGIRECSYLGVPVVNIGSRQQGRERAANVLDVPHEAQTIHRAVQSQRDQRYQQSQLYGDGKAGARIAEAIRDWKA